MHDEMMKAGRALNALVTEKIMGMEPSKDGGYHRKTSKDTFQIVPAYSKDLAMAWIAADRMCERYDCTIEVKRMASFMSGQRYAALVCGGALEYKRSDITAYGTSDESPAHALCLAMLEAVGVEVSS